MFDRFKNGVNSVLQKIKTKELTDRDLRPIIDELVTLMIKNEVAVETAEAIGKGIHKELMKLEHTRFKSARPMIEEALRQSLVRIFEVNGEFTVNSIREAINSSKLDGTPYVICVLGINGTGKTTTIAKLTHLFKKWGYSVVLSASDTFRAGSIEQLENHADRLGVRMVSHDYGGDPAAVAIDAIDHAEAKGKDIVIIDTAGRMQNNINLVRELQKIIKISDPDLKIFVGDSLAGNDVIRQAKQFNDDIGIDGIIMTKLDSDAKGGAVLSVAHITKRPILFIGTGQSYDDLVPFNASSLIKEIIPM